MIGGACNGTYRDAKPYLVTYCNDIHRLIHHAKFEERKPAVRGLLAYSAGKISELSKIVPTEPRP